MSATHIYYRILPWVIHLKGLLFATAVIIIILLKLLLLLLLKNKKQEKQYICASRVLVIISQMEVQRKYNNKKVYSTLQR